MSLEYIRRTYDVPAFQGGRIKYTNPYNAAIFGTIIGADDAWLKVRIDGARTVAGLHPTDGIEYLGAPTGSCPECGRTVRLKADGTVRHHGGERTNGWPQHRRYRCAGTGQEPTTELREEGNQ
ncbi:hypothetical protein [Nocardia wallacei]|uniref:hypothetical protein n=1 Tax=Nocardia wallacei TaxID=480035 RepID=UPI002453A324|nr:hypothetical protein [Nocardia wallacei]